MEKIFLEAHSENTKFNVVRFGNVAYSHGSVLPYWLRLKSENLPLPLTSKDMNRLMLSKHEAAKLIHYGLEIAQSDNYPFILTKLMKSVNMYRLASLISDQIEIVGLRDGEKLNEVLVSSDELPRTFINGDHILIRQFENRKSTKLPIALSSQNSEVMSDSEILKINR